MIERAWIRGHEVFPRKKKDNDFYDHMVDVIVDNCNLMNMEMSKLYKNVGMIFDYDGSKCRLNVTVEWMDDILYIDRVNVDFIQEIDEVKKEQLLAEYRSELAKLRGC